VGAVWDAGEHPADVARGDLEVRFHLPALESLLGRMDVVDRVVVRLRDVSQAPRVRDDLRAFASGYDVYTADELVAHTSRTFVVVSRFHRAIALITVFASGIFLITIMTLKLSEMRREIGALRLLGIGRGTIGLTVVAVAAAVAVMGSIIGAGLGAGLVWAINAYYQPLFETRLRFAVLVPETLVGAGGLAIAVSLAAGVGVALRLLRRHPLEQVGR
jgi:putative ABC transport system permease protein